MFKHRVARNRFFYTLVVGGILTGFAYLVTNYQLELYQLVLFVGVILVPNRLVKYYWFDFFVGKRELRHKKIDEAQTRFTQFLETVRISPWIKWLMFFSYGLYSFKVEAVALAYLGMCHLHKRNLDLAETTFQQALSVDSKYAIALFGLAAVSLFRQKPDEARARLEIAQKNGYRAMSFDAFTAGVQREFPG